MDESEGSDSDSSIQRAILKIENDIDLVAKSCSIELPQCYTKNIFNMPSTSDTTPISLSVENGATAKKDKKKKPSKKASKTTQESKTNCSVANTDKQTDPDYVSSSKQKYAKMTDRELDCIANRIRIYHETGVVLPDEDVIPCQNKYKGKKKNKDTNEQLPQIPGPQFGKGRVGVAWEKNYGAHRCTCCNDSVVGCTSANSSTITSELLKKMPANFVKKREERLLQQQQRELLSHPEMAEYTNREDSEDDEIPIPPPWLTSDKREWIQKFIDTMSGAERFDYQKPKLKNVIDKISHEAVTMESNPRISYFKAKPKIMERIDFKKEMEVQNQINEWLRNTISSSPSFNTNELHATSTPVQQKRVKFATPIVSTIEEGVPGPSHLTLNDATVTNDTTTVDVENVENDRQKANVHVLRDLLKKKANNAMTQPSSRSNLELIDLCTDVTSHDYSSDFSHLDTSNVTLRTPRSKSSRSFEQFNVASDAGPSTQTSAVEEFDIMNFVDRLLASNQDAILQEAHERCDWLLKTTEETKGVLNTALDNICITNENGTDVHDEVLLDNSVQIVEEPTAVSLTPFNDDFIQLIDDDSDVEIVDDNAAESYRILRKRRKIRPNSNTRPSKKKAKKQPPTSKIKANGIKMESGEGTSSGKALRDCPICLESLGRKEISSTICGHVFCTACISAAVRAHRRCPNCRTALSLKKIHPLFI